MIEEIKHEGSLLAVIVFHDFVCDGIKFLTPPELSQQLAYMHHPTGKMIVPHQHNPVKREVHITQEVLCIRKGKLRVDFYDKNQRYLESRILHAGDTILLIEGGHGFEVLEEVEMIEVKQGPFSGEKDKTRFEPVARDQIVIKGRGE